MINEINNVAVGQYNAAVTVGSPVFNIGAGTSTAYTKNAMVVPANVITPPHGNGSRGINISHKNS